MKNDIEKYGYIVSERILSEAEICGIESELTKMDAAGERTMLEFDWCKDLAFRLQRRLSTVLRELTSLVPVQCTYFQKNQNKNWLVAWHQDRTLPLAQGEQFTGPIRMKGGREYYQPSEKKPF